ncbi:hypothetical protein [Pseudomonas jinjuensis]|uniref:hypothetical protein n=1 Tax=Pseudomonas jinjuensis TaxID=198616 RepID=UPI001113BB1C|nr:hypothetical protein [Pseudomonas jinjuensis]
MGRHEGAPQELLLNDNLSHFQQRSIVLQVDVAGAIEKSCRLAVRSMHSRSKTEMPHSLSSQLLARSSAVRAAAARAQLLAVAAGYYFYGYWFSHRRA